MDIVSEVSPWLFCGFFVSGCRTGSQDSNILLPLKMYSLLDLHPFLSGCLVQQGDPPVLHTDHLLLGPHVTFLK